MTSQLNELSLILLMPQIFFPPLSEMSYKKRTDSTSFASVTPVMSSLRHFFLHLNLFETKTTAPDQQPTEEQHRLNIYATRLYLLLLLLILIAVALVFWWTPQTLTTTLDHPSQHQFEDIAAEARCACSRISLSYADFVIIAPLTIHPVCTSDFVSERWIRALAMGANATYFNLRDYRTSASAQFQALAAFCRLSQQAVHYHIAALNSTLLISPQVSTRAILDSQVRAAIDDYRSVASNTFQTKLQLVRDTTMSNKLVSGLQTNAFIRLEVYPGFTNAISLYTLAYPAMNQTTCNCNIDRNCQIPAFIFDLFNPLNPLVSANVTSFLMQIPGLRSGCTPVDAMLQSTLELSLIHI